MNKSMVVFLFVVLVIILFVLIVDKGSEGVKNYDATRTQNALEYQWDRELRATMTAEAK